MEISIKIPDQVWAEDPAFKDYFQRIQEMVNRMAVSHFKYGPIHGNAVVADVHELRCALQRISMYDSSAINQEEIWPERRKKVNTGNTENLLDAANFLVMEAMFPKHEKGHFVAQPSEESPGLIYGE